MFGSSVLDTAIGLALIYLTFSLVVTSLNEMTATVLALRAKNLETGLRNLLRDDTARQEITGFFAAPFWWLAAKLRGKAIRDSDPIPLETPIVHENRPQETAEDAPDDGLATRLYRHGLIDGLSRERSLPSYIPPSEFAQALFDLLTGRHGATKTEGRRRIHLPRHWRILGQGSRAALAAGTFGGAVAGRSAI